MKKLLLAIVLAAFAFSGKAYDFEADGFYYNITSLSDLTVALTGNEGTSYSGDIIIPQSVEYSGKTFTVTSIESSTFSKSILGTLTIPKNIMKANISAVKGDSQIEIFGSFFFYLYICEKVKYD